MFQNTLATFEISSWNCRGTYKKFRKLTTGQYFQLATSTVFKEFLVDAVPPSAMAWRTFLPSGVEMKGGIILCKVLFRVVCFVLFVSCFVFFVFHGWRKK